MGGVVFFWKHYFKSYKNWFISFGQLDLGRQVPQNGTVHLSLYCLHFYLQLSEFLPYSVKNHSFQVLECLQQSVAVSEIFGLIGTCICHTQVNKPISIDFFRQKVITTLPTFEVNISDKRLLVLWKFFRNFPLPTSTSIGGIGEDMLDGALLTSVSLVRYSFVKAPLLDFYC